MVGPEFRDAAGDEFGGEDARGVARQAEGFGHRAAELRVAECHQDERERVFVHQPFFVVARRHAVDQAVDRLDDRVERVVVARRRHPCRERARAAAVEGVEGEVDDFAHIAFARRRFGHFFADRRAHGFGLIGGERLLQPRGAAEMVEQVRVGAVDPRRDGFQCHRRRPHFDEDMTRGLECRRTAFLGTETLLHY